MDYGQASRRAPSYLLNLLLILLSKRDIAKFLGLNVFKKGNNVATKLSSEKGSAMSATETMAPSHGVNLTSFCHNGRPVTKKRDEQERKLNSILMKLESLKASQKTDR